MNIDPVTLKNFCNSDAIDSFDSLGALCNTFITLNFALLAGFVASILQKVMIVRLKDNASISF